MLTSITLLLILLFFGGNENDNLNIDCKIDQNESLSLNITINNKSDTPYYIYGSFWEVNGIIDEKDMILGLPDDTYLVNMVWFFPLNEEIGKKSRGHKGGFPEFDFFPKLIEVKSKSEKKIKIILSRILTEALKNDSYYFEVHLYYMIDFKKVVPEKPDLRMSDNVIFLPFERRPVSIGVSNYSLNSDSDSFSINELFSEKLIVECKE